MRELDLKCDTALCLAYDLFACTLFGAPLADVLWRYAPVSEVPMAVYKI